MSLTVEHRAPVRTLRRSSRRRARLCALRRAAVVVGGAALFTTPLFAQEGCEFGPAGNDVVNSQTIPGMGRVTYITRPHFICAGGVEIFADSAVAYGDRGMSHLMGAVRYLESSRELRAEEARYFSREGRLQAEGDVSVFDEAEGSSIENGDLVYLLRTEFRDEETMTVTTGADGVRPRAVLAPPANSVSADQPLAVEEVEPPIPYTEPPTPYTVVGDRIFLRGTGYFTAVGDVRIVRDSLLAYADSAEYDEDGQVLSLLGSARVDGTTYDLTGQTIRMATPDGPESEIRSLREARLVGDGMLLTSAQILVRLRDGALDRLIATPLARPSSAEGDSIDRERPEAFVDDFVLTADSLDVSAPSRMIEQVLAIGRARSVSTGRDSLNAEVLPEIARTDWLEGDTVIIRFTAAPDELDEPVLTQEARNAGLVTEGTGTVDAGASHDMVNAGAAPDTVDAGASPDTVDAGASHDTARAQAQAVQPPAHAGTGGAAASPNDAPHTGRVAGGALASEENDVEEIIARGRARSLYRLPPNDSTSRPGEDPPAVHYVVGDEIRIRMDRGEVRSMRVAGQTQGVHVEPLRRRPAPDTMSTLVDSLMPPDSAGAKKGRPAAADTTGTSAAMRPYAVRADQPDPSPSNDPKSGAAARRPEETPWIRR